MTIHERKLDPDFEAAQVKELQTRAHGGSPYVHRLSAADLLGVIHQQIEQPLPTQKPLITLTPRHPYDDATASRIDSYHAGRWDTESDLVFMSPIVQTGPSPGQWDGTVVYVAYPGLTAGIYLVAGVFSGYDVTMSLSGPWGQTTAYSAITSNTSVVLAQTTVSNGLWCSMHCKGSGLGYLSAVRLFQM